MPASKWKPYPVGQGIWLGQITSHWEKQTSFIFRIKMVHIIPQTQISYIQ